MFYNIWRNSDNFSSKPEQHSMKMINICKKNPKNTKKFHEIVLKYSGLSGAKACKSCRSRQELSNGYFLAKFGADTEENGSSKICSSG